MQVSSNSDSFHQSWDQMKKKVKLQSWLVFQLQLSFSAFWSCSSSWDTSKGRGVPDKDRMKIRTQSMACTTFLMEATLMTPILKSLIAILIMLQSKNIFNMQSRMNWLSNMDRGLRDTSASKDIVRKYLILIFVPHPCIDKSLGCTSVCSPRKDVACRCQYNIPEWKVGESPVERWRWWWWKILYIWCEGNLHFTLNERWFSLIFRGEKLLRGQLNVEDGGGGKFSTYGVRVIYTLL